jgi:CelD/BcsL family acetyltransferase involved in cellulose biosynthesis
MDQAGAPPLTFAPLPTGRPRYRARAASWSEAAAGWSADEREGAVGTAFQHAPWLEAWYGTLGREDGVEPLVVTVEEEGTRRLALRLPLVRRRRAGLTLIEFADLDLTDYNGPLLGEAAPRDAAGARALWRAVRRALPEADLVRLVKMPVAIGSRPNPLALLTGAKPSSLNGNLVTIGESFDAWRFSLQRPVRRELERSWRVFGKHPDAEFRFITDPGQADRVLATMEAQQDQRMHDKGEAYHLDDPAIARFYRRLVQDGLRTGFAVLSALTVGEVVVAALLGIQDSQTYIMVRISHAGEAWANCSPGRLVIERTMAALHAQGFRRFDFSIGNYAYKRRFGVEPLPLADLVEPLSWKGLPGQLRAAAAARLRRHPRLDAIVRRALGLTPRG